MKRSMGNNPKVENSDVQLRDWMQAAGIASFRALARQSGVSRYHVNRLRQGEGQALSVQVVAQLAQTLNIPLLTLVQWSGAMPSTVPEPEAVLRAECQRLQDALMHQQETLQVAFQTEALNVLESFLLYWPVAALKAQQDPSFPASRLITLLKPLETLLDAWGVVAIAPIGAVVPYDPTIHQWIAPDVPPPAIGEPVQVSHGGYRHHGRLLYRAKVRQVESLRSTEL